MNHHPDNSVQDDVLAQVRAGKVHRRPRTYFIIRLIATLVVSGLVLLFSALVISFILFSLHESGEQFLLGFGFRGVLVFFALFPWLYSFITLALLFLLEWLLRGFKFAYRMPLLNIFGWIMGLSFLLGLVILVTPLHASLLDAARNGQLPLLGDIYTQILTPHEDRGVSRGRILSIDQNSFVIQHDDHDHDHDDTTFTIDVPPGSNLTIPPVGTSVIVFGEPKDGAIEAEHIQIVSQAVSPEEQH